MNKLIRRQIELELAARNPSRSELVLRRQETQPQPVFRNAPAEIVDLLRFCAILDRVYAARYMYQAGKYLHVGCARLLAHSAEQYDPKKPVSFPSRFLDYEACAWCGIMGLGATRCGRCGHFVCAGKTVGKLFKCRPSCGCEGQIEFQDIDVCGMSPRLSSGST